MITSAPSKAEPSTAYRVSTVALICAATIPLLSVPSLKWLGWLLIGICLLLLLPVVRSQFTRHMAIIIGMLMLLGLIPINTDISYIHMLSMGAVLIATVALPYVITAYGYKENIITLPFRFKRKWHKKEIAYVFFAGSMAYLLLPYYLYSTGSYLNWNVTLDTSSIIRLFVGTNGLGIWDELFFVGICLTLLRSHLPFIWANLAQATLWTAFLFELGFQGWGPFVIFFFAITQGIIFKNSKSLLYIITVHLTIDFILFLTLIHLHYPHLLRIFITSPF